MTDLYISVGIDVGADFSFLHIALILYLCRLARIISTFVPLSALPVLKYQPPFQALLLAF